ncbi:phenoloxidase-activating factor 1 isoform X3 [Drosophila biarmipes]|nr:phenoloxidase-activating factor 1 isoform X3 [Drosophila biarmipes]
MTFVCCPTVTKPAFVNCQPNEQCASLNNCPALKGTLESEDLKKFKNQILREKKCGRELYCCPKSADQQPNEVCTRLDKCQQLHIHPTKDNVQKLISRHCAFNGNERFSGQRIYVFCPRPAFVNCQPNEQCASLNNCPALKGTLESEDLKKFKNQILREKKCGRELYCCPKSADQQPNEVCTRLDMCQQLHIHPTKDNVQKLISRHCDLNGNERFSGKRIYVFCPRPVCQANERCLSSDNCQSEQRRRQCGNNAYCCQMLSNNSSNKKCKADESCVPLGKCPHMHDIIKHGNATFQAFHEIDKVRLCKVDDRQKNYKDRVYTCCPKPGDFLPDPFKQQCGQSPGSFRIAHGNEATPNQFPWIAMLLYENTTNVWDLTLESKCGGSLINNWYVLTAAHCVTNLIGRILKRVRLGEHNTKATKLCDIYNKSCAPPPLEIDVKEVIFHVLYNHYTEYSNDIALVRLEIPVRYTREIKPICVPRDNFRLGESELKIAGWGLTENGTKSHVLLYSTVRENAQYCINNYVAVFNFNMQICAGGQSKRDTCKGDSGGPLMATQDIGNYMDHVFVAGITSFAYDSCGKLGIPGLYTRTGAYFNWIQEHLKP